MYRENLTFRCCALLLIVVSQSSSTSADKKNENSTVQCELDGKAKRNCDEKAELARNNLHENATKHYNDKLYEVAKFMRNYNDDDYNYNDDGSLQDEFLVQFINYLEENNLMDLLMYFTEVDSKNNSNNGYDSTNYIVPYEMCDNITCIQLCCPLGNRLVDENCIAGENEYVFPNVYGYSKDSVQSENKTVDELFKLTVRPPCQKTKHFLHNTNDSGEYKKYMFYTNGSLYLPYLDLFVEPTSYCLAVVDHNQFDAIICSKSVNITIDGEFKKKRIFPRDLQNDFEMKNHIRKMLLNFFILYLCVYIISLLCSLITFLVYSLFTELRNMNSFMLRRVTILQFMGDMIFFLSFIFNATRIYYICITNALITYFFLVANLSWITVMNFDMWRTFKEFRPIQRNVTQQDRKKLIYSIFAWGFPFILLIICVIMEFVSNVPEIFRPRFGVRFGCWFSSEMAQFLFFSVPQGICNISSMCFSNRTKKIIAQCEKDMTHILRNSDNRCYNENKEWSILQRKLNIAYIILLTMEWIIGIAMGFCLAFGAFDSFMYLSYSMFIMNSMRRVVIFLIFVCKKRIIRLIFRKNHEFASSTPSDC